VIDNMALAVTADTKNVSLKEGGTVTAVNLSIPTAKVNDMTAYNDFLPKGSPVRILGGTADLSARVEMREDSAGGFVKFKAANVAADIDGYPISGTLGVDVKIKGGSAKEKTFDITGSSLTLDSLRAPGTQRGWNARIDLGRSKVVWNKPAKLDASASFRMTDTRPLIDLFFEARGKGNKWLDRIFDLKDVRGNATIRLEPNEVVIPYALVKSDTIAVGAKGFIREEDRQGMFYAKYGAIAGVLVFENGRRRFGLINATKKFEEYVPGEKLPGMRSSGSSSKSKGGGTKKDPFSIFKRKK
jgi:hypothetical protein